MKLLLLLGLIIGSQGRQIPQDVFEGFNMDVSEWMAENTTNESVNLFAKLVVQGFIHRLQKQMIQGFPSSSESIEPKAALLPPYPDPAWLSTQEIPLDFSYVVDGMNLITSTGHTSYCEPEVNGLSDLTDEFTLGVIGQLSAKWNLEIPSIAIHGPYRLDQTANGALFMNSDADHYITGEGDFSASVKNVFLTLDTTASVLIGPINVKTLTLDFGYSDFKATTENSAVDGVPVDLGVLTSFIDTIFKAVWTDANKPKINEAIRCNINHIVGGCTLTDLIGGNVECLDLTLDPACFEESKVGKTEFLMPMDKQEFSSQKLGFCDQFTTATTTPPRPTTTTVRPTTTEKPGSDSDINIDIDIDIDIDINININP